MSPMTMGLTAHGTWKYRVPASATGIHHAMNPDPYKGIFGGANCRDSPAQVIFTRVHLEINGQILNIVSGCRKDL